MTIKNVSWNKDDQLSDSKFQKMIDNDNYNYSLATSAPRGLLFVYNFPLSGELIPANRTPTRDLFSSALILGKTFDESDRLIKICISDCTINDSSVTSTFNPISSRKSVLYNFNFKTTSESSVKEVDFFSDFRPFTSSSFQANWRTQAAEFLVEAPGPDFRLSFTARKVETINTTGDFRITYGTISLYDVGKA